MKSATLSSLPSIRISAPQLRVLETDVRVLSWKTRDIVFSPWFLKTLPSDYDFDTFVICNDRLWQLWKRLDGLASAIRQQRFRLSLDVLEAGLCISALRAMMRKRRQLFAPASSVGYTPAVKRQRSALVRSIENYERRLRRRFEQTTVSPETCAKKLYQFAIFRKAIVHEVLQPEPAGLKHGFAEMRRTLFLTLVKQAEDGLHEAEKDVPPPQELKKMVSQFLRAVRRYRFDFGMRDVLFDPSVATSHLIPFIEKVWRKTNPNKKPDYATLAARAGDIVRALLPEVD
jgi:hypothetical protein